MSEMYKVTAEVTNEQLSLLFKFFHLYKTNLYDAYNYDYKDNEDKFIANQEIDDEIKKVDDLFSTLNVEILKD
jgi:hypothetical protein